MPSYSRDWSRLVNDLLDDGGISLKVEALEAVLFEQRVQMRRWESFTDYRAEAPPHHSMRSGVM